jgi:hypothetical protein
MVEDINNLLNSGEVPNLFMMDEKIEICEKMRILDRQRDKIIQVLLLKCLKLNILIIKKNNVIRLTEVPPVYLIYSLKLCETNCMSHWH